MKLLQKQKKKRKRKRKRKKEKGKEKENEKEEKEKGKGKGRGKGKRKRKKKEEMDLEDSWLASGLTWMKKDGEKKPFFILACIFSSCTIRGAGSLFIFLEGLGLTIQNNCAKIKMDIILLVLQTFTKNGSNFGQKSAGRNQDLWERDCRTKVVLVGV